MNERRNPKRITELMLELAMILERHGNLPMCVEEEMPGDIELSVRYINDMELGQDDYERDVVYLRWQDV